MNQYLSKTERMVLNTADATDTRSVKNYEMGSNNNIPPSIMLKHQYSMSTNHTQPLQTTNNRQTAISPGGTNPYKEGTTHYQTLTPQQIDKVMLQMGDKRVSDFQGTQSTLSNDYRGGVTFQSMVPANYS